MVGADGRDDGQDFWQNHACGDAKVGGLRERFGGDYEKFVADYDQWRYSFESHLPACFRPGGVREAGAEVGLGQGADSDLIRRGAHWSGIDLTSESVDASAPRLTLQDLPFGELVQGSVLDCRSPTTALSMVFSHGVLHHVPEIRQAERADPPGAAPRGELVIMMYARWSLNYLVLLDRARPPGRTARRLPARQGGAW